MVFDECVPAISTKDTSEVARNLRSYASASVGQAYASKLLAIATELEAMATNQNAAPLVMPRLPLRSSR